MKSMQAPSVTLATVPEEVAHKASNFFGRRQTLQHIVDWLDGDRAQRFLCLTGEPGTGKSAFMAWLAGAGPPPGDPETAALLDRVRSALDAVHFCVARHSGAERTLDPTVFGQHLAEQLTSRYPAYGTYFLNALHGPSVQVTMEVGQARTVIGPTFGNIQLADAASLFNRVCEPLRNLSTEANQQFIFLVDALDEARLWAAEPSIVDLVVAVAGIDVPANLRFVVSCRPVKAILDRFPEDARWDLIGDAHDDHDDIRRYAVSRIPAGSQGAARLVDRIVKAGEGNFLYAKLALDYWLPRLDELGSVESLDLPGRLDQIYAQFLSREYGSGPGQDRWNAESRPLLGTIGVAQMPMASGQIEWLLDMDAERMQDILRRCDQYLDGEPPEGPFTLYHQSFREFLFNRKLNSRFPVSAADGHGRIARRYVDSYDQQWENCHDDYGLRFVATHSAEAARFTQQPVRHNWSTRLVRTVLSPSYQQAHEQRLQDETALFGDLELALGAAANDDHNAAYLLVVECALHLRAFRAERLQLPKLFDLARAGRLDEVERRLQYFNIPEHWRQQALLISGWLAAEVNPAVARSIVARFLELGVPDPTLNQLVARLGSMLKGNAPVVGALPATPPEVVVDAIVRRLGGTDLAVNPSMLAEADVGPQDLWLREQLASYGFNFQTLDATAAADYAPIFAAAREGPLLVSFAAAHPGSGDRYLRNYITLHAANSYAHYRQQSLWALLPSVIQHPDDQWTKDMVLAVTNAALAGGTLEFDECVPSTVLALRAAAGHGSGEFRDLVQAHAAAARAVTRDTGGDAWGAHKRRLGVLAEARSRLFDLDSTDLLELALTIPYGFAGFSSPAHLTLAESIRVCRPADAARVKRSLEQARAAAHNVQDPVFCVRMTSRWNALAGRWWKRALQPTAMDLTGVAERLATNPAGSEFSAVHIVGEEYGLRTGDRTATTAPELLTGSVPLSSNVRTAATLAELSRYVYATPLSELLRLNSDRGFGAADRLPPGTEVNIPDREFTPLLAAWVAGEALVQPNLSSIQRRRVLQLMVPVAAANPTALDTTLGRLLLDARPTEQRTLGTLSRYLATYQSQSAIANAVLGPAGAPV